MSAWLGIGLVLALLALGLAALRAYQRRCRPSPESVRKLFHVTSGAVGLALPLLFHTIWPVVVLAGVVLAGLLLVRRVGGLRAGIGSVIHGVERRSLGDVCFPIGVCAVFALVGPGGLAFAVPMLVLTLADPAAALVGLRYGRHRYRLIGDSKTLEGSAAFFAVAFGCAAVPLTGAGGELPPLAALVAFALALTVVEALAPDGLDNALIPIAGVLAFDVCLTRGTP